MQICKECPTGKNMYKILNKSHMQAKHNMSMEEYNEKYPINKPVKKIEIKELTLGEITAVYDSLNLNEFERNIRRNLHIKTRTRLFGKPTFDRYTACKLCGINIFDNKVFIRLNTVQEIRQKRPMTEKDIYHELCAYYSTPDTERTAFYLIPY